MRLDKPVPVKWIADFIGAEIAGNSNASATGINEIHKVEKGDVVFVDHPKYYDTCINSAATIIIINKKTEYPDGKTLLMVDDPFEAYLKLVNHFRPFTPSSKNISDSASVGKNTVIMPNAFIGNHVIIGNDCIIHPNVTILDHCVIGNNVIIQAGTVIGSDAFYYNKKTNRDIHYKKMNSCGRAVIEDFVHIGHDTEVGKNCLFAGQVGIAGATIIEDNVILWGQVGVSKTLTIGKNATVYAQSGVKDSIDGGKVYFGSPVEDAREKMKEFIWIKRIPQLWEKVMGK